MGGITGEPCYIGTSGSYLELQRPKIGINFHPRESTLTSILYRQ